MNHQDFFQTQSGNVAMNINAKTSHGCAGDDIIDVTNTKEAIVTAKKTQPSKNCFSSSLVVPLVFFIVSWAWLSFRFFSSFEQLKRTFNNLAIDPSNADMVMMYTTMLSLFATLFMMPSILCIYLFATQIVCQNKE